MSFKKVICIIIFAAVLGECGVISPKAKYNSITSYSAIANEKINLSEPSLILGDLNYVKKIKYIVQKAGSKAALNQIMSDVDKYGYELDNNNQNNNYRLYCLVSSLIENIGYVGKKVHYFRNKLNRAPKTLKELLYLNSRLKPEKKWKLMPVKRSLYHMQGDYGEYNLKFLSSDGFCEAVYNKDGVLLTEKNDPVNMGTFNFSAGMHGRKVHKKYDVNPYLKWGNTPDSPEKGYKKIKYGKRLAKKVSKNNKLEIALYRNKILRSDTIKLLLFTPGDQCICLQKL